MQPDQLIHSRKKQNQLNYISLKCFTKDWPWHRIDFSSFFAPIPFPPFNQIGRTCVKYHTYAEPFQNIIFIVIISYSTHENSQRCQPILAMAPILPAKLIKIDIRMRFLRNNIEHQAKGHEGNNTCTNNSYNFTYSFIHFNHAVAHHY